jgi:predicted O-methyltransferase YrrM
MTETERVHGPNWVKWLSHLIGKPAHGLEIGTFKGESAQMACKLIFNHPESTYTCVDTFAGSVEHFVGDIDCSSLEYDWHARMDAYPQATVIKGLSNEVLRTLTGPYDFVYVDAAHDSLNVMRDAVLAWDLLKPSGVMIFDDYHWNVMPDKRDCPALAINSLLNCFAKSIDIVAIQSQVAVRKLC